LRPQVDLALENAGPRGSGGAVTANLEPASQILDDELYFGPGASASLSQDSSDPRCSPRGDRCTNSPTR
jgi:hypothetical protein